MTDDIGNRESSLPNDGKVVYMATQPRVDAGYSTPEVDGREGDPQAKNVSAPPQKAADVAAQQLIEMAKEHHAQKAKDAQKIGAVRQEISNAQAEQAPGKRLSLTERMARQKSQKPTIPQLKVPGKRE